MRRSYGPMHEQRPFRRGNACVALFGKQRLLSGMLEGCDGIVAAMCCVNLNPVRAGLVATSEQWEHAPVSLCMRRCTAPDETLRPLASRLEANGSNSKPRSRNTHRFSPLSPAQLAPIGRRGRFPMECRVESLYVQWGHPVASSRTLNARWTRCR